MSRVVFYLHGFLSSPASVKAQQTLNYVQTHRPDIELIVPKLSNYPEQSIALLNKLVGQHANRQLAFIGSSMGGFLSTYLLETYGGRAVLINSAVHPDKLLQDYLGEHINPYTNEKFTLTHQHAEALAQIKQASLKRPEHYWVLLQTGDETLDYRDAADKYTSSKLTIEEGGDHSFQGFDRYLPEIFTFLLEE